VPGWWPPEPPVAPPGGRGSREADLRHGRGATGQLPRSAAWESPSAIVAGRWATAAATGVVFSNEDENAARPPEGWSRSGEIQQQAFARRNRVCNAMAHSARNGDTSDWSADTVTGSVPGTLLMESAGCGQRRSWMLVTLLYGRTSYTRGRRAVGSGEPSASGGQRFSSATPCQPHWGVHRARQAATKGLSKMEGDGISRIDSASVSRQCGCGCGWS
jgi:hypothetical protein